MAKDACGGEEVVDGWGEEVVVDGWVGGGDSSQSSEMLSRADQIKAEGKRLRTHTRSPEEHIPESLPWGGGYCDQKLNY